MAANKDDDDNPFSFKAFVSTKEKKEDADIDLDVEDIFEDKGPRSSSSNSSKGQKPKENPSNSASGLSKGTNKKSKPKENPFSFKKFLSGSGSGASNDSVSSAERPVSKGAANGAIKTHASILPDLWGDSGASPLREDSSQFDLLEEMSNGSSKIRNKPSQENDLFIDSGEEDSAANFLSSASNAAFSGTSSMSVLPDFLSDGAALNASSKDVPQISNSSHEDLCDQVLRLQRENKRLRNDLAQEQQSNGDLNQRISQLQRDLKVQKKKEVEETKVMEKAVMQVEENLVTTTQRAIQAEATAVKLKQEIKSLQSQVKVLTAENQALLSGDGLLSDIRERTKYTSQELQTAAVSAEKSLKELSLGVDKLKLLSQVLSSLEKISEVKPEAASQSEPKGS